MMTVPFPFISFANADNPGLATDNLFKSNFIGKLADFRLTTLPATPVETRPEQSFVE